jgi:deferrochelatase/peroxidase EfeB
MSKKEDKLFEKKISRRDMLKLSALTGVGIVAATSGVTTSIDLLKQATKQTNAQQVVDFFGTYQAGIVTSQQEYGYFVAFDLTLNTVKEVKQLLRDWTMLAQTVTKGETMENPNNELLPPNDTGDSLGLNAQNLTITIGYGLSLFEKDGVDRFGIRDKKPIYLNSMPKMAHDSLQSELSDGDILFQVCSDDRQVAVHAVRNLIRMSSGRATVRFLENGFIKGGKDETPRNLFGFKDGTANVEHDTKTGYDAVVWADQTEPTWFQEGTYLGYRKIKMLLEIWDRSSLLDQEDTFGRKKESGAAYGRQEEFEPVILSKQPIDSHVKLAKDVKKKMHRRAYSYQNGIDEITGTIDAGLLFIAFTQNPEEQYIPMLQLMGRKDKLNEYTIPIGNGLYACQKGLKKGEYFGQQLFAN